AFSWLRDILPLRSRELLEELVLTLLHFLRRQVFLPCGDRPLVAGRIGQGSRPIPPELVLHLSHRTGHNSRAGAHGFVEHGVTVLGVDPESDWRSAVRLR